jgi:rubrerythrin
MTKNCDPKYETSYLHDLSIVESNYSVLYTALADRVNLHPAKSLLLSIASDHNKHAVILKGIDEGVAKTKVKPQDNEKEFAEVFGLAYDIYKDVIKKEEIPEEELPALVEKLSILESALREKYLSVQSKRANLDNLSMFEKAISDGERHLKLLGTIKTGIEMKEHGKILDAVVIDCLPSSLTTPLPHSP